ncbi:beta-ribofuranosylaminobenzene 5'-phosphate synthase family protein [Piscinibacter sakaiensis]|uniref:beta-ribofuranosylaminobenzene 5'-phosphate synthase family protein n=1 Tax=Piscinibacter sakaiensis TaxID=1547922 RepID=UPI0006B48B2D|nr:beta-ribofuranosylaminobenzene 5'-phosphate synthase family protein [Piscinibacter sakaiensis]
MPHADAALGAGVEVAAPGRLHLGFLDPSASLGRRFGSLGLVVDGPETLVELRPAARDLDLADTPAAQAELPRARAHLETLREALRAHGAALPPLRLRLKAVLPAHAGLGSGTQLALAVGRAACQLAGVAWPAAELARRTGRGLRSGIGIAGFEHGGLLLDGGPQADGGPALPLARLELPAAWRIVLALDPRCRGLSGAAERAAIATLPPLPREAAAEICHEVLMRVLPGAAGAEFTPFAAGLTRMQRILGRHFAPAQPHGAYTSAAVGRLLDWVAVQGPAAVGQSSWGPTGFALLPSAEAAQAVVRGAADAGVLDPALDLRIVAARAHGAALRWLPPA